jgi:hypothetical protein
MGAWGWFGESVAAAAVPARGSDRGAGPTTSTAVHALKKRGNKKPSFISSGWARLNLVCLQYLLSKRDPRVYIVCIFRETKSSPFDRGSSELLWLSGCMRPVVSATAEKPEVDHQGACVHVEAVALVPYRRAHALLVRANTAGAAAANGLACGGRGGGEERGGGQPQLAETQKIQKSNNLRC